MIDWLNKLLARRRVPKASSYGLPTLDGDRLPPTKAGYGVGSEPWANPATGKEPWYQPLKPGRKDWSFGAPIDYTFPDNVRPNVFSSRTVYDRDIEAVAPLWDYEHRSAVIAAMDKDGWFWVTTYERVVGSIVDKQLQRLHKTYSDFLPPSVGKLRQKPSEARSYIHWLLVQYACSWICSRPSRKEVIRSWLNDHGEPRRCLLCGRLYRLIDTHESFYRATGGEVDFCFPCMAGGVWGESGQFSPHKRTPKRRKPMLVDLKALANACGFVPPADRYRILLRVPRQRRPDVMAVLVRIRPTDEYKAEFGSYLKALIAAGILADDTLKTPYGTRCVALDGHECHSLAERTIDDWLYQAGIPHEREPLYPHHPKHNPSNRMRADWLVRDTFVEYLGLVGMLNYDEKMTTKQLLAHEAGIKLICIKAADLERIERLQQLFEPPGE